jgi:hypothetical protein
MTTHRPGRRALSVLVSQYHGGARRNPLIVVAKNKEKPKKSRKDAQLVLRLNKDLRNRFVDACQDLDTSAAREVRRFIKQFLRRYDKGELDD